jgi:hypothetical protein
MRERMVRINVDDLQAATYGFYGCLEYEGRLTGSRFTVDDNNFSYRETTAKQVVESFAS